MGELDRAKNQCIIWAEEGYQEALARIRGRGITNGLTTRGINGTFRLEHAVAASAYITLAVST